MVRIQQATSGRHFVGIFLAIVLLAATEATSVAQQGDEANQVTPPEKQQANDPEGILNLDIEQLARTPVVVPSMDIPVTSVTRTESTVGQSPAAVFVITNEMIRRSGATCIPEALRMAPGLEVARIDASKWAITARGFNSRYANKLLVLIDGRTVYNPVYSGVDWDMQDVLLEDIERIEVVRGPGGTLWGANAVNGVISIITKKAKDTQGTYLTAGGGTKEKLNDAFRYGGRVGEDIHYRVYGKHFERGAGFNPTGQDFDAWSQGRAGFRMDWDVDRDKSNSLTVQGDCFTGEEGSTSLSTSTVPPYSLRLFGKGHVSGENLLARWRHVHDEDSDWALQLYYDHYCRKLLTLTEEVRTFDVDFQYRFPLGDRHSITCGAGCRSVHDRLPSNNPFTVQFIPPEQTVNTASQFIQDEITLVEERLALTMGVKLEENAYTGLEYQPSARLLWTPDRRHSFWGAISRAVRTPSRLDRDFSATAAPSRGVFPRVLGSHDVISETLIAYEIGYRAQATEQFSWDIAAFYNRYEHLVTVQPGMPFMEFVPPPPHMIFPLVFANGPVADTYGVELAVNWTISERWRLYSQYTFFEMSMLNNPGVDPRNQVYLSSSWNLGRDLEFDLIARYVDSLSGISVPSYIAMDLRLGWRPRKHLELAFVGQNLLQTHHLEFGRTVDDVRTLTTEVCRGVYGTVTWRR